MLPTAQSRWQSLHVYPICFFVWCRCFPADQGGLKNEPSFEQDKCSVSWHADSTLEHFSTIGVYHCTSAADPVAAKAGTVAVATESKDVDASWRIALRVWYDAEGPNATRALSSRAGEMSSGARIAPAVAVPLPSGSAYFLLDDFNHHHQHAGKDCSDAIVVTIFVRADESGFIVA